MREKQQLCEFDQCTDPNWRDSGGDNCRIACETWKKVRDDFY